jgi:hypothetical protein
MLAIGRGDRIKTSGNSVFLPDAGRAQGLALYCVQPHTSGLDLIW